MSFSHSNLGGAIGIILRTIVSDIRKMGYKHLYLFASSSDPMKPAIVLVLAGAASQMGVIGCGGARLIDEPQTLTIVKPIKGGEDEQLHVFLDWVIVRNGQGAWVHDADWDEYLLRVRNISNKWVRIQDVAVTDSLCERVQSSANRKKLVDETRHTVARYKSEGLEVKAGLNGPYLILIGSSALVTSGAYAIVAVSGSVGAGAAGAAVAGALIAPAMILGGMIKSKHDDTVARHIVSRHTALPIDLSPGEEAGLDFFFPIAPSPTNFVLTYNDRMGQHSLSINLRDVLRGLHIRIVDREGDMPCQTP